MKKLLLLLLISPLIINADSTEDKRLVSELSINELKEIVRSIVDLYMRMCVILFSTYLQVE